MSWVIVREVSGKWGMEATNRQEDHKDVFYVYGEAVKECRKRNKGRVAPTSEFDNLFGPLDDEPKGLN